MLSTILELGGFAAFAGAALIAAGVVGLLVVVGVELLVFSLALDAGRRRRG